LQARELSARELVEATLGRIDVADADVHAVVSRDDEAALAAADAADAERARAAREGRPAPPLLGLPLTIKDCLDAAGLPTLGGSTARAWTGDMSSAVRDRVTAARYATTVVGLRAPAASRDATTVARLRAAGAIPLLKTNVPELCSAFETDNVVHGLTRNPLDLARTPGGSSGGEGALLGADASIVGLGTDGGGSIRVPSHFCGIVGLRPTTGRTPETGLWPPTRAGGTMDFTSVGPMARHVEDLGLLLAVIAGADGIDPYAVDVPLRDWRAIDPTRLRVAFYDDHPHVPATTPGTRAAVHAAAAAFERAGCRVEPIDPPTPAGDRSATDLFFAAAGADGGAGMRAAIAGSTGHKWQFQGLLDATAPDADRGAAGADRGAADAGRGAPGADRGAADTDRGAPGISAGEYLAIQAEIFAFRAAMRALAASYDVILSPVDAGPAPLHGRAPAGIAQEEYLRYEAFDYCHIYAVAGLPSAAVPVGVDEGLPIGVQLAAPAFREDLALAAATLLEAELGGFAINRRIASAAR
jgi:Asp-tRNA(Asn)/Glu-tRNA(Gln) amidotransferase A subunit family amidase